MKKITLTKAQEERAQELNYSSIYIDALAGNMVNPEPPERNGKSYLERCEESGVTAMNVTLAAHNDSFEKALKEMYHYHNLFAYYPDRIIQVKTVDDLLRCHEEGKIGIIFGFQTSTPASEHMYRWTILKQVGLRVCSMSYNEQNALCSGAQEPEDKGLTFYGIQAVREMNRQGILIDLSHVGERSSWETIDLSSKPCTFTHSNPFAVTPSTSKRNISDEMMKFVASKGGVVGLCPHAFLCHTEIGVQPGLEEFMDHFEYSANLIGVDHIGIGSDIYEYYTKQYWECKTKLLYDSPWLFESVFNRDLKRVDQYINIPRGLVALGFSDEDIRKILGLNYLRVFGEVWN